MQIMKNNVHNKNTHETPKDAYLNLESHSTSVNFKIDPTYSLSDNPEDQIHRKILYDEIHTVIQDSPYKEFNEVDEEGNKIKLNKVQINKVYSHVLSNINIGYKKIEIWEILSEYFDIYPNKFYSSLSNIYKHELIIELDELTGILGKKKIKKLF
jgi:hypothetical protein